MSHGCLIENNTWEVVMKIVIVGAGYAGTMAANRLARRARGAEIVVVNPRPEFVERIRLHQVVAGSGTAAHPLTEMLDESVTTRIAAVTKIADGSVALSDGGALEFDRLVYAVGGAPSAPEGAVDVGAPESAAVAAERLRSLPDGASVDVVGGGLTGVETATEIAARRRDVRIRLFSDAPIARSLGAKARAQVAEVLAGHGVEVVRQRWSGGRDAALTVWANASRVGELALQSGLEVNDAGRVVVDDHLRSVSDPRVIAVGDGAAVPGSRMSCQAAIPQGVYAADLIAADFTGRSHKPYSVAFVAQCVSLGRSDGVVQRVHRDDSPASLWLRGRTAAAIKEQVCRSTVHTVRAGRYAWKPGAA